MSNNGILSYLSKKENKEVDSISFYIVVNDGEIEASFDSAEMADGYAALIDEEDKKFTIEESEGGKEEFVDDETKVLIQLEGNEIYVEHVYVDEDVDLDGYYTTKNGDNFTYNEIVYAYMSVCNEDDILNSIDDTDFEESDDDEEDDDEDDDDDDEDDDDDDEEDDDDDDEEDDDRDDDDEEDEEDDDDYLDELDEDYKYKDDDEEDDADLDGLDDDIEYDE